MPISKIFYYPTFMELRLLGKAIGLHCGFEQWKNLGAVASYYVVFSISPLHHFFLNIYIAAVLNVTAESTF